jgi:hypothetical protein
LIAFSELANLNRPARFLLVQKKTLGDGSISSSPSIVKVAGKRRHFVSGRKKKEKKAINEMEPLRKVFRELAFLLRTF